MRPSVRSSSSPLPCDVRPPGISTFSATIASRTWVIDRPYAFSFSMSTTMWISRARAPVEVDLADAVDRLERALDLLVGDLGERRAGSSSSGDDQATSPDRRRDRPSDDRRQQFGGSCRIAPATFSRTSLAASLRSRSSTNLTVIVALPSVRASTHLVDAGDAAEGFFIGSITDVVISSGLAPGSASVTLTVAGSAFGNRSTPRSRNEKMPSTTRNHQHRGEDRTYEAQAQHEKLVELVAEGNDALLEEFFEKGTIPEEDLIPALHNAIREDKIFPVIFGSGLGNIGADRVMDFIVDYTPAPSEHEWIQGDPASSSNGEPPRRHETDTEPVSLYVFKTVSDPFAGRISYFKVFSGVLKNDATVVNYSRSSQEKMAHISIMQGKNPVPVNELHAGDIGAVAKLKDTLTGDTLGDKAAPIQYPRVKLPEPAITFAIEPKSRADEDKLGPGIHKLMEEDAMLRFFRDAQTKEFLIAGTGQQHIEVVVSKMKKRYHTEVVLKAPKVPYRETIRGKADVQGKHKKQTGGHGQYGDCKIKMEPLPRGGEFEFVNDIFGGSIPKNYIPAIEKGIKDAAARGYLAGFPVVDFRVILYDGSYHDVDSNDMSFQMAGRIAFKKAMEVAKPTLLEPVMAVEITVPDDFAGSIMGDLNSRRGRIQGMDNKGGNTVVKAEVPMAEMLTYGVDLTSMTQGRGSFNMEMHHYDAVPGMLQEKIVEKAKAARGDVKEEEE